MNEKLLKLLQLTTYKYGDRRAISYVYQKNNIWYATNGGIGVKITDYMGFNQKENETANYQLAPISKFYNFSLLSSLAIKEKNVEISFVKPLDRDNEPMVYPSDRFIPGNVLFMETQYSETIENSLEMALQYFLLKLGRKDWGIRYLYFKDQFKFLADYMRWHIAIEIFEDSAKIRCRYEDEKVNIEVIIPLTKLTNEES